MVYWCKNFCASPKMIIKTIENEPLKWKPPTIHFFECFLIWSICLPVLSCKQLTSGWVWMFGRYSLLTARDWFRNKHMTWFKSKIYNENLIETFVEKNPCCEDTAGDSELWFSGILHVKPTSSAVILQLENKL